MESFVLISTDGPSERYGASMLQRVTSSESFVQQLEMVGGLQITTLGEAGFPESIFIQLFFTEIK